MVDIKDIVFTTNIIKATDRQKELIEDLLSQVEDYEKYEKININNLSKQDASKLIDELFDEIEDYGFELWYESERDY